MVPAAWASAGISFTVAYDAATGTKEEADPPENGLALLFRRRLS